MGDKQYAADLALCQVPALIDSLNPIISDVVGARGLYQCCWASLGDDVSRDDPAWQNDVRCGGLLAALDSRWPGRFDAEDGENLDTLPYECRQVLARFCDVLCERRPCDKKGRFLYDDALNAIHSFVPVGGWRKLHRIGAGSPLREPYDATISIGQAITRIDELSIDALLDAVDIAWEIHTTRQWNARRQQAQAVRPRVSTLALTADEYEANRFLDAIYAAEDDMIASER